MKKILLAFLFAAICGVSLSSSKFEEDMKKVTEDCIEEHGIQMADLEELQTGEMDPETAKDNMKCAMHCIWHKTDYLDENGKMKPDSIRPHLGEDEKSSFEKAFIECDKLEGSDHCDTAFRTFACMMKLKN